MHKISFALLTLFVVAVFFENYACCEDFSQQSQTSSNKELLERGKYLVIISGCNDCHTPGFAQTGGTIPEDKWLIGDSIGWRGPWGTTYPANLRNYMQKLTESQWIALAKALKSRPPMPSYILNLMSDDDLRAIYTFVRSLGSYDKNIPAYVPPDKQPNTQYILFEPQGEQK